MFKFLRALSPKHPAPPDIELPLLVTMSKHTALNVDTMLFSYSTNLSSHILTQVKIKKGTVLRRLVGGGGFMDLSAIYLDYWWITSS